MKIPCKFRTNEKDQQVWVLMKLRNGRFWLGQDWSTGGFGFRQNDNPWNGEG